MKCICAVFTLFFGMFSFSYAAVTQTIGAGSAITVIDRSATFAPITTSGMDLSAYSENQLSITVPDSSYVGFDAFGGGDVTQIFYGSGGNTSYVTINTTDNVPIRGVEFLIGNGNFTSATNVVWEAWKAGSLVGSGTFVTPWGTVVGWNDPSGFDELRVGAWGGGAYTAFGQEQAIAIDNVNVQITPRAPVQIPTLSEWGMIILCSLVVIGAISTRRRQRM